MPLLKILPGFAVRVDAFCYHIPVIDNGLPPLVRDATSHVDDVLQGGQQLPGLLQPLPQRSSRWRSPIYCSQVTGNLVHQQLRVNPRWVVDLGFQTTAEVSRHGRRAGDPGSGERAVPV